MNPSANGSIKGNHAETLTASIQRLESLEREHQKLKKKLASTKRSFRSKSPRRRSSTALDDDDSDGDDSWKLLKENTNVHGLKDLFFTSSCKLKVTWMLLLILAGILTVHGCYTIIMEYLLGRVVVSYFIYEAPELLVPDIVICPFNRFNRSYLTSLNVSAGFAQYLELSFPFQPIHPFQESTINEIANNLDFYETEREQLFQRLNITYKEFLDKAALDCSAFFQDTSKCESATYVSSSAGRCFRLPGGVQYRDGFDSGDRIIINLPIDLYALGANQIPNDGVIVKLVEQGRGIDHDFTFVPPGVHAVFPISAVKYEFMHDPPAYMCQEQTNQSYSKVYCFEKCLLQNAENLCNCSLAGDTSPRKTEVCTTTQYYDCFLKSFENVNFTELTKFCRSQCPPPCTYWAYDKHVSYAKFPSQSARFFVPTDEDWERLKSTIIIDVYYKDLQYTVIKHVIAMPLQSLIAQIGGQFSLWAGGSLISLLQLVIYLSRHFYHRCNRVVKRQRRKSLARATISKQSKKFNGNGFTQHLARETSKYGDDDSPLNTNIAQV
ncbi:unnamed protein product, partial [Mesorhabditis spiculigera]